MRLALLAGVCLVFFSTLTSLVVHGRLVLGTDKLNKVSLERTISSNHFYGAIRHLSDGINNVFAETVLWLSPSYKVTPELFWNRAVELGGVAQRFAEKILRDLANSVQAGTRITELQKEASALVESAKHLREGLGAINEERLENELKTLLDNVFVELQLAFPSPDEAPSHEKRLVLTQTVLEKVRIHLLELCATHDIPEDRVRSALDALSLAIEKVVVLSGDLIEQHPDLTTAIVFFVAVEVLPVASILRPLTNMLGFGPIGPVKGSIAAWSQRTFYGAEVTAGSMFSLLQRAGMTPIRGVGKIVLGGVAGAIGFGTSLCFRSSSV